MKAIHDMFYPTPPASYDELRWRLQVISELKVGRLIRRELQSEQDAADALMSKLA